MSTSRSFDRVASIYDQTRPLHEPIAKHGLQAILDIAGPKARILDVGTGTGRISVPLLEHGADLIGCDISTKMLRLLQEKLPAARIAQADASQLPFPDAHFDVVLTVHVLHLIPPWREALREFRRVLVPGGVYLNVKTWEPVGVSIRGKMREFWRDWLKDHGVDARPSGLRDEVEFQSELQALGAQRTEMEVVRYPLNFTLRGELEHFASRTNSNTWDIPEDAYNASLAELHAWVAREYSDLDPDKQLEDQVRFVIDIIRFPQGGG
jgi:ubiquinone/menaquinone biosynthesis C-methylase UbiE